MPTVTFDASAPNDEEQAKELALQLFSYENFLFAAIPNFRAPQKRLNNLSASTSKAVLSLASLLPPPQKRWQTFAETLEYPMSMRLEEIHILEDELLKATEAKPFNLAVYRTKERQLKTKTTELKDHIFTKEAQKQKLLQLVTQSLQNPDNRMQMKKTLNTIAVSKARAKKYELIHTNAEELMDITTWMGNGPFPFSPLGQLLAPIPLLVSRFAFRISHRNNPSQHPPKLSQKMDIAGTIAGVSAVIIGLVATASTPLLPLVAASAFVINSITATATAFQKYQKSNAIMETPAGKKIRRQGHLADIIGNVAGAIGSTGLLGIAIATTISVMTVAFPPATLALLGAISLGVAVAALGVSAAAYFRKTILLKEADNQKLLFDFKNACEHGVLNDFSLTLDAKKLRSLAAAKPQSEPIPLLAAYSKSTSPTGVMIETIDEQNTVKQFERVLALGFIPHLIDSAHQNIKLTPNTTIQIKQHSPPDPRAAIEAITKVGGIPKFSDPKEQAKMLKNHSHKHDNKATTQSPDTEHPFIGFNATVKKMDLNPSPPLKQTSDSPHANKKP